MVKDKEVRRRKWILGLGFSEAEADSFIEFEVPNWKIEALAEVRENGKIIDQTVTEPEAQSEAEPTPAPPPEKSEKKAQK